MYQGFVRARVGTLDPLRARELGDSRVFYSNFRSAYLNSAPLFLLLFVREWLLRRLFCAPTWYARIASRVCRARAYICVCMCEHYNPPLVPLLNFTAPLPPLPHLPTLPVRTCNGRVACHSIAHARWEPTHTRTFVSMCIGARVLARAPCPPMREQQIHVRLSAIFAQRKSTRRSVWGFATWPTRVKNGKRFFGYVLLFRFSLETLSISVDSFPLYSLFSSFVAQRLT